MKTSDKQTGCLLFLARYQVVWHEFHQFFVFFFRGSVVLEHFSSLSDMDHLLLTPFFSLLWQQSLKVGWWRTDSSASRLSVAANTTAVISKKVCKIPILSSHIENSSSVAAWMRFYFHHENPVKRSLLLHLSPAPDQGFLPHLCGCEPRPGGHVQTQTCGMLPSMQQRPSNQKNIWMCARSFYGGAQSNTPAITINDDKKKQKTEKNVQIWREDGWWLAAQPCYLLECLHVCWLLLHQQWLSSALKLRHAGTNGAMNAKYTCVWRTHSF